MSEELTPEELRAMAWLLNTAILMDKEASEADRVGARRLAKKCEALAASVSPQDAGQTEYDRLKLQKDRIVAKELSLARLEGALRVQGDEELLIAAYLDFRGHPDLAQEVRDGKYYDAAAEQRASASPVPATKQGHSDYETRCTLCGAKHIHLSASLPATVKEK